MALTNATSSETKTEIKYCFTIASSGVCPIKSSCCDMTVYKVEFDVVPACRPALARMSIDGAIKAPFFNINPPVIKVVNINKAQAVVDGTEICLFLRKSTCNGSLATMCGGGPCTYGIFNNPAGPGRDCCPIGTIKAA